MSHLILKAIETSLRTGPIDSPAFEAKLLYEEYYGDSSPDKEDSVHFANFLAPNLKQMIDRRVNGEPLQHILGNTCFYGLDLKCDRRALVPRQDTELIVDACLELIDENSRQCVADLGTGSGCILLALLSRRTQLSGIGIDISKDAIALATENLILNNLNSRTTFLSIDWNDWNGWDDCALIVCNPPYIASDEIEKLPKDVRDADPRIALDGGTNGLKCFEEISKIGKTKMKSDSWLVLEIGYDQGFTVPRILEDYSYTQISVKKDLSGHDRVVVARR